MYGCTRNETLGKNYLDTFISDRDRSAVADDVRKVLEGLETRGYENPVRCSDGSERLLMWNVSRVLDDRGQPTGIIAVGQDITDRKATDDRLGCLARDLRERVKELNCLFALSELIEHSGNDWAAVASGMLGVLRSSWQYPEITCVRIVIEQREFQTDNYRPAPWTQHEAIRVSGESVGHLEIGYLEERPEAKEGPFLEEERSLLTAIAVRLGRLMERIRIEGSLLRVREEIAVREQQRIGQELHDDLGQELTGLGYLAESLYHDLQKQHAEQASTAEKLAVGLQHALERARTIAQGLAPLGPGIEGLIAALKELRARRKNAGVSVVDCSVADRRLCRMSRSPRNFSASFRKRSTTPQNTGAPNRSRSNSGNANADCCCESVTTA